MKRVSPPLAGIVLLLALPLASAAPDPVRRTPVVRAVEKVSPAVVNVSTRKIQEVYVDPFFRDFFGRRVVRRPVKSLGSGVIVHPDGYVITNGHVVRLATEILVSHEENGKEKSYPATLLDMDEVNDLALLKIRGAPPLPSITLGRSDDLMVGEPVIAVGNPFGVGKTVTTGVISALNRSVRLNEERVFRDFIQTDAAINPGNSGGPLLNIHGELIGVNTAILRGAEGLGFAIPADRVKEILGRLLDSVLRRANLGFRSAAGGDGVTVRAVDVDGAALRGGLRAGDVIEKVDDRPVRNLFDFATPLLSKRPGDVIRVEVRREGRPKRIDLTVPLPREIEYVAKRMGILGTDLSAADRRRGYGGVLVRKVLADSPAARVGLKAGDLVQNLGSYEVRDLQSLASLLERAPHGLTIQIGVLRKGREMTGNLTLR